MHPRAQHRTTSRSKRVKLAEELRRRFQTSVFSQPASDVAKRSGLSYLLVYNIIKGRVTSITERHYRLLFGEDPPDRQIIRVAGDHFRGMVELWLFLNDKTTKLDLYKELCAGKRAGRPDYRIFTGHIQTVAPELEKMMEKKFNDSGIDRKTMLRWMEEFAQISKSERVPYRRIRPHLLFLKAHVGVHPNALLQQQFDRYETGRLKSVSREVFEKVQALKTRAEKALTSNRKLEIQRLRETVYGPKTGYILYAEVTEELYFLRNIAQKSPKKYLGRSAAAYEQGKIKRIAAWRAAKIHRDCLAFVALHPSLAIETLPQKLRIQHITTFITVLVKCATSILLQAEGVVVEKQILAPSHNRTEYGKQTYGFTLFERAPSTLGMKQKAFDLMVAQNCDIFRQVGKYTQRWYLSDLYLKELSQKSGFNLISAKYELLANRLNHASEIDRCMH